MLTDGQASAAQAGDKDYKLADANGLYLFVTKSGFKSWRMKYRFGGKEKRLTFGGYPEVSLEEARERRDQARRLLRDQVDPAAERQRLRGGGVAPDDADLAADDDAQPALDLSADDGIEPDEVAVPSPVSIDDEPRQAATCAPSAEPVSIPPSSRTVSAAAPVPSRRPSSGRGLIFSSLKPSAPAPDQPVRAGLRPTPEPVDPPTAAADAEPVQTAKSVDDAPRQDKAPSAVPAEDEPRAAVPFTPEVTTGSRALALLRQAEDAVAEARRESRTAKRIAAGVLALFLVAALGFVWWLAHQHGQAGGQVAAMRAADAGAAAPAIHAAALTPGHGATASSAPTTPAPPAGAAVAAPAGTGASAAPAASVATPAAVPPAGTAGEMTVKPPVATTAAAPSRHRKHRRHHRHGRHHRRHEHASTAPKTTTARHSHSQETFNDVQVTAPRGADAIDPALDRYGRAALCLRAAYSADPVCAALRATGRQ
jgi:hypothetical protein